MTLHNDSLKIPEDLMNTVQSITKSLKYSSPSSLFYAGQTPIVAYLILEGLVHFKVNGNVVNTFGRGSVIGLKELMNDECLQVDAQVQAGTKACFIDRSTVIKIMSNEDHDPLKTMITKLITIDTDIRQSLAIQS